MGSKRVTADQLSFVEGDGSSFVVIDNRTNAMNGAAPCLGLKRCRRFGIKLDRNKSH
jgi:hypothetical protein